MDGGGGSQNVTQTSKVVLSPEQRELFNLALPAITEFAQNPPGAFPGQTVAGFDPAQLAGQQSIVTAAQGGSTDIANAALQASQFFLGAGLDPRTNPFLQSAIGAATRPITEQLTQATLPAIRGEAITSGQFGGSRQGIAEGLAAQGASRATGDVAGTLASQGYQAALDAGIRALGLAPATGALQFQPGGALSAVGAERQSQEQAGINAEIQRFMQEQLLPFLSAKEVAGLAFGMPGATTVATGATTGGGISPIQGALGGAATGAVLATTLGLSGPVGAGLGALLGLFG